MTASEARQTALSFNEELATTNQYNEIINIITNAISIGQLEIIYSTSTLLDSVKTLLEDDDYIIEELVQTNNKIRNYRIKY